MEYIYDYAFRNCSGLEKIVCEAIKAPKTYTNVFQNVSIGLVELYVPASVVEVYSVNPKWGYFGQILPIDPTGINETKANVKHQQQADGKYIKNGKIYVVKNGLKYNIDGIKRSDEE